ncbi:MAG: zinc-dependent alcohol dehydrogenase family protein [Nitrospirota bacterium]
MKAVVLKRICKIEENQTPLELVNLPVPLQGEKEVLVNVSTCAVCHTELDEIEGRIPPRRFPLVLGHQIVGRVEKTGIGVNTLKVGDRVGIAWIHSACGKCSFCLEGNENLCDKFEATGRDVDGGYAQYTTVSEDFSYKIPDIFSDSEAAPLLCAGAIGYRSLRLTRIQDGQNLGLIGFGASAHLVIKMVRHRYPNSKVFVFTRTERERSFAEELGAFWTGGIADKSPQKMHCAIDTTQVWRPVVEALKNLEKGGVLIINAIRKEEADKESLLKLDYPGHLWLEKEIKSIANVTRKDVSEFLELASEIPIRPEIQEFRLEEANKALVELKERKIRGAKVLKVD